MRNIRNLAALTNSVSNVRQVLQLPLDRVVSKPQVRVQFRNLNELADSLKEEGQQSPIIVSPKNSRGEYVIQKGERRWRAAKLAGLERIDVIINNKDQSPIELLAGQLVENIQRDDLTPLEIAEGINKLTGSGWSKSKVAQRLGKRNSYVTLYSTIHNLNDDIKALHNDGHVTDATALSLLGRIYELDQEQARSFFNEIRENEGMSRERIRQFLARLTASPDEENYAETDDSEDVKYQQVEQEPADSQAGSNEILSEENSGHDQTGIQTSSYESDGLSIGQQQSQPTTFTDDEERDEAYVEPNHEVSHTVSTHSKQAEYYEEAINAGAHQIGSNNLLIEVLVSDGKEDHIAQLMLDFVSDSSDMAWVLIDGKPSEIDVTTISILEIRDKSHE